jgi:DNA-binding transcriptional MerR regulator
VPDLRIDELAREAGVATTTVRLYQNKGLLRPPRLEGRTGYYDDGHLARLRLIARLQGEGFSLASIGRLLETWEAGRDVADLVGVEAQLDRLVNHRSAVTLRWDELASRFGEGALTPDDVQRASALGLVEVADDGLLRVPDERFLDAGSALVKLGVPPSAILDEWELLATQTDEIATRFVALFEAHLVPAQWESELGPEQTKALAGTLDQLRRLAELVAVAALDASIERIGTARLASLLDRQ